MNMHNNPHSAWKSSIEIDRTRESRNERAARWLAGILLIGAVVLTIWLAGCAGMGAQAGAPVYGVFELLDESNKPVGWVLYDTDVCIAHSANWTGQAYVAEKTIGVVVLGPLRFDAPNQTLVTSRKRSFKGKFSDGDAVPAWVTENYPLALLTEHFGLVIEGQTTTEALAKRPRPAINFVPQPHNGG